MHKINTNYATVIMLKLTYMQYLNYTLNTDSVNSNVYVYACDANKGVRPSKLWRKQIRKYLCNAAIP